MSTVTATTSSPLAGAVLTTGTPAHEAVLDRAAETQARLARAKERLYVLCQVGGWGTFTVVYYALGSLTRKVSLNEACIYAGSNALGFLLSHLYRVYIHRAGWKELAWAGLVPRIIAACIILSTLWTAAGWPLFAFFYEGPMPKNFTHTAIFFYSLINGLWIFALWSALYFVYHAFDKVSRLRIEQLQLAASVKEAELRALKSQVNPHFLFNSLNSLRALIDEDAPRARESVTRLSNMLRYSLSSGQQETVLLEDELRVVEDYLALEQIRHEERLQVRWEIAPEARRQPVPPMLLQTLVENAVKYGISPRRGGGEVVVYASVEHGALHLRVTNPGELGPVASSSAARAGSSTGVGLRNASERLKLLFGDRAMLRLLAEPAGCVTADVHIPLAKATP